MIGKLLGLVARSTATPAAPLPWRVGGLPCQEGVLLERHSGMIYDGNGRHIATVDEWAELPDDEAKAIATMIVGAVNARGARARP